MTLYHQIRPSLTKTPPPPVRSPGFSFSRPARVSPEVLSVPSVLGFPSPGGDGQGEGGLSVRYYPAFRFFFAHPAPLRWTLLSTPLSDTFHFFQNCPVAFEGLRSGNLGQRPKLPATAPSSWAVSRSWAHLRRTRVDYVCNTYPKIVILII
jgi:hypothetical protein